ncbi:MAG TPA: bifunctional [glutamine synthetase] adenylyltransferase/[glutamine synthetase]-adenylyl-L-tyrosine phosphorylase [Streptosporangiaceae bacterium]|nr:bifunctional [glutamine synthetase] adenylyltransferase/[glutamine synthetase]-adenylyl-L-tyrosine phosphorylase [Streptosporangiaceae bacterium]
MDGEGTSGKPWRPERRPSLAGRLARLGFTDATRAERLLATSEADIDDALIEALSGTAHPDLALSGLLTLIDRAKDVTALLNTLDADEDVRDRLLAVLGVSAALGDHLARHPGHWRVLSGPAALERPDAAALRAGLLRAVGADPDAEDPVAGAVDALTETEQLVALRVEYRRHLLRLAGRDLTGAATVDEVAEELADLAAAALEGGLAIARAGVPDADSCRLAVIGMGKCGGRELNYASDVDVIFVAEPRPGRPEDAALRAATRLASGLLRACSASTTEGALWQVDAALRPEGKAGPLVRTLASHEAYYRRWAKTWEFQALLKARPVAGDRALGQAYVDTVGPLVWRAAEGEDFVEDVQAMRRRVEDHLRQSADTAERELKLGPGGLRDVEFAVQLLQLVHGRADESLRSPTTLVALEALSAGGYVGRDDAGALMSAYRFLRRTEHLVQLHRLRRTHLVPADDEGLRRLGRALAAAGRHTQALWADPIGEFTTRWRRHAREVRRIHEKLFYRPLLRAVARLPGEEARLTPAAARARLEALGYTDPAGALRHIEALSSGVSRRAAIQRTLLPVMLGWFADAPDPDAGLLGFRQVSEALGTTPWYLRLLRDDVTVAERMARMLASSRYATDLLLRAPDAVAILGSAADLTPRAHEALLGEALAAVQRRAETADGGNGGNGGERAAGAGVYPARPAAGAVGSAEDAVVAVRALRRMELFRVAVADLSGLVDVDGVGEALTDIAAVTIEAALRVAVNKIEMERRAPLPTRLAIVAMGRFGGHELGYGSDADVMFVHDPLPGAAETDASTAAHAVAEELRRLLALPAPDPPLVIDPNLRPEGRQGPLVRTLASYAAYYRRWSSPWESQALLRADPLIGDSGLSDRFRTLIDPVRWPQGGVDEATVREIRRLKARMEAERLPRGVDRRLHTKLGPGGLSDVEWVAQLLQLRHAYEIPALRTTRTLATLTAAAAADLLTEADATALAEAWRLATRIRNAVMLVRGRASDVLPSDHHRERSAVSKLLGYSATGDLLEDYSRRARRARAVVDRVFYGLAG